MRLEQIKFRKAGRGNSTLLLVLRNKGEMSKMAIIAPRGAQDVLPSQSYKWRFVERILLEAAGIFGYKEMRTPTFEAIELFMRSVGDTTDVVQKEMFEVKAQKGTEIYALKPEGTAGVVRAALERGLLNDALPLKVCYITPCFRHERPQAGRLREFHQFGCEVFGSSSPGTDVEAIALVYHIFEQLSLKGIELNINSIGCPKCRPIYYDMLREYFASFEQQLCDTCIERLQKNPMRILDCKCPECQAIAADAPKAIDSLCDECDSHFNRVQTRLSELNIPFVINTKIVRGLDYYTKTVFEFISDQLGAQSTVAAGGRYDGLVEQLGGKPCMGLGFGMGIERLLMLIEKSEIEIPIDRICDLYIGSTDDNSNIAACNITDRLRNEGFSVECDLMDRSIKAQMKYANKLGARFSMILGESELKSGQATLKDMCGGEPRTIDFEAELVNVLYDEMLAREADSLTSLIGDDAFKRIIAIDD